MSYLICTLLEQADNIEECKKPDGTSLVEGPVDLSGRSTGKWAGGRGIRVGITEIAGGDEDRGGEPGGDGNVVGLRRLISRDKNRHALAKVDVKRGIANLQCVCSFDFHHLHLVPLNAEVERILQPHVAYTEPVCFSWER